MPMPKIHVTIDVRYFEVLAEEARNPCLEVIEKFENGATEAYLPLRLHVGHYLTKVVDHKNFDPIIIDRRMKVVKIKREDREWRQYSLYGYLGNDPVVLELDYDSKTTVVTVLVFDWTKNFPED